MLPVMEKMEEKQGDVLFTLPLHRFSLQACTSFCAAFNGLFAEILIVVLPSPLADHCTWSPVMAGVMIADNIVPIQQVVIGQEFPN